MDIHDVVTKLVGPINAVGETREDALRFSNLKVLTVLVELLLRDISVAAQAATREEASMRAIGLHAKIFLREVREQ